MKLLNTSQFYQKVQKDGRKNSALFLGMIRRLSMICVNGHQNMPRWVKGLHLVKMSY